MKTAYIAFDGKLFEDESECAHYELSKCQLSNCCFFSELGDVIDRVDESNIELVYFAKFDSINSIRIYNSICDEAHTVGIPEEDGTDELVWMYSSEIDRWIPVRPLLRRLLVLLDGLSSLCHADSNCLTNLKELSGCSKDFLEYLLEDDKDV